MESDEVTLRLYQHTCISLSDILLMLCARRLYLPNTTGIALKTSDVDLEVLDPREVAKRLMSPCQTCRQLAKDSSCPDVMAHFGVRPMKAILRQFSGPPL